jgi:hypothetical protein
MRRPEPASTSVLVDRRVTIGIPVMLMAGVGLAVAGAIGAFAHDRVGDAAVFVAVGTVIGAVALLVRRGVRWATILCLAAFAGQLGAVIGTGWELTHTVADVKAGQLRAIGFDPVTAVTINLVYSFLAFILFCWFVTIWWRRRRGTSEDRRPA